MKNPMEPAMNREQMIEKLNHITSELPRSLRESSFSPVKATDMELASVLAKLSAAADWYALSKRMQDEYAYEILAVRKCLVDPVTDKYVPLDEETVYDIMQAVAHFVGQVIPGATVQIKSPKHRK